MCARRSAAIHVITPKVKIVIDRNIPSYPELATFSAFFFTNRTLWFRMKQSSSCKKNCRRGVRQYLYTTVCDVQEILPTSGLNTPPRKYRTAVFKYVTFYRGVSRKFKRKLIAPVYPYRPSGRSTCLDNNDMQA